MMTEQQLQELEMRLHRMPVVLALIAEVRRLQQDVAFHADCRPNRQQAEAAIADAKATNDRWADAIRERDAALAERDAARTEVYSLRQMVETWHVRAEAHRQANEATTQALTEARRVLREAEWGKSAEWCCVCLNHEEHGHARTCALAAVLAQEESS